jgi:magnesium-transporting ATPase (P-type)
VTAGREARRWHALDPADVVVHLGTDAGAGLTTDEAARRADHFGPNVLRAAEATPGWVTLLAQFRSPLITILLLAGLLTIALGELIDAGVIAAVLGLNAGIGFFQERKAEASVLALMQLLSPTATVVRDGHHRTVESADLVPGDVVLLESGVRVPADLRLVSSSSLRVDESLLTGESVPVDKQVAPVGPEAPLADRVDMVFSGAVVTSGRGRGVVVATGEATELGLIAEQVRTAPEVSSPLQQRMRSFAHVVGAVIAASAALTFALGLAMGGELGETLLVAAALAVAAIPEGLPVVLTVALALGVRRMAQRNAIVRRLAAVETLGSTTLIGSDKTGTLTENRMAVQEVWAGGRLRKPAEEDLPAPGRAPAAPVPGPGAAPDVACLLAGVLANEAHLEVTDDGVHLQGDPTETAFLVLASRLGLDVEASRERWEALAEIPFESERRYAASFRAWDGESHVFVKGAPERVLSMCTTQLDERGVPQPVDGDVVHRMAEAMAARGLRVLATAARVVDHPGAATPGEPSGLCLLGLVGLVDPPRPGVRDAIAGCQRAGQRVVMITGDHAATARAIALQLGIVDHEAAPVLTGVELDDLDDAALRRRVEEVSVFARVSPEHKLRIVTAARDVGHVVAVTGDGVNDAPALKHADIGIAMGRAGTDVAREASDIVLTDDDFVSIYAAVEEGRVTFENVRKVTFFLVSTGFGTFVVIPVAMLLGWPLVLLPAQLLWANLVTKGLQDLALAFEPPEPDVLAHPPRGRREPVITPALWWRTLLVGTVMGAGTLFMYDWARAHPDLDLEQARTVALTTLVVFQAFHLGSSRSELRSVFSVPPFSNRFLILAQVGALAVHAGALVLPPTQLVLRVAPIPVEAWARLVVVAATVLVVVELDKALRRRSPRSTPHAEDPGSRPGPPRRDGGSGGRTRTPNGWTRTSSVADYTTPERAIRG